MHYHQTGYGIFVQFIQVIYRQTSITVITGLTYNACSKTSFILHCVGFKIKLLTGVLLTSPVLLLFN